MIKYCSSYVYRIYYLTVDDIKNIILDYKMWNRKININYYIINDDYIFYDVNYTSISY